MAKNTEKTQIAPESTKDLAYALIDSMQEIEATISLLQTEMESVRQKEHTDGVKAALKGYKAMNDAGIAPEPSVYLGMVKNLSESEMDDLQSSLSGGLNCDVKPYTDSLDAIRADLLAMVKKCSYKKGRGVSSATGDRKVKLSDFVCRCPICQKTIGSAGHKTQKHLIVNSMRVHMEKDHQVTRKQFNENYRATINDATTCTMDVVEEIR